MVFLASDIVSLVFQEIHLVVIHPKVKTVRLSTPTHVAVGFSFYRFQNSTRFKEVKSKLNPQQADQNVFHYVFSPQLTGKKIFKIKLRREAVVAEIR